MQPTIKIKDIFNNSIIKDAQNNKAQITLFLILIFIIQYFHDQIEENIIGLFILPKVTSSFVLDMVIFLIIDISLYVQIRWLVNKYKPSLTNYLFFFGIWFLYFSFRFSLKNVQFDSPKLFNPNHPLGYIDYLILSTIPFIILCLIRIIDLLKKDTPSSRNFFIEDLPIEKSIEDKIGFSIIIEQLHRYLITDYYQKSFTVGVIAPWGHGKSSFLELLKNRIKRDHDSAIQIDFFPFLNHNSKDIILEYFKTISEELSKYNGRLSGQLIDYAQNLAQAYKNYNISNLFEVKQSNNVLTKQYLEINSTITEINKPILVYIDDLDRLNGEEILTVFKIIRNSANFANTVFLIGIDINHIRQELINLKISDPNKYLKKFFQLEINLPLISKDVLKEHFIEIVLDQIDSDKTNDFNNQLRNTLQDAGCLFDEYIENFRDLKRIVNQYVFQKQLLKNQIDDRDLINYLMLISNYPKFLSIIQYEREVYFSTKGDLLILKKTNLTSVKKEDASLLSFDFNKKYNPEDYILSANLKKNENDVPHDKRFHKTLYQLFGDENDATEFSLRRLYNLNLILEYNYSANYLSNEKFEQLKFLTDFDELLKSLKEIDRAGQLKQFIDHLQYDKLANIESFKFVLNSLIISYCIIESESLQKNTFYHPVSQFLNSNLESSFEDESIKHILNLIKNNKNITLSWRLRILTFLDSAKKENSIDKDLSSDAIDLFEVMLSEINNTNYQYELFNYYHDLKNDFDEKGNHLKEILNEKIKVFLSNEKNLVRFCQHITDNNNIFTMFKISDVTNEMFGSKFNFSSHVKEYLNDNEFLHFLSLLELTSFKQYIAYNFQSFQPIKNRIDEESRRFKSELKKFIGFQQIIIQIPAMYINEFYNLSIDRRLRDNDLQANFYNDGNIILIVSGKPKDNSKIINLIKSIALEKLDAILVETKDINASNIFDKLDITIKYHYPQ